MGGGGLWILCPFLSLTILMFTAYDTLCCCCGHSVVSQPAIHQPIPCYLHTPNCEFQTTQRAFSDCNQNCLWEIMHLKKLLYYAVISIVFKNLCFLELISQKAIELSIKHFWEINTRWIHVVQIRTSHYICNGYLRHPKVIEHGNCAAVSEGFYWHLFCLCFAWAHNCRNIPPWWLVPNLK